MKNNDQFEGFEINQRGENSGNIFFEIFKCEFLTKKI